MLAFTNFLWIYAIVPVVMLVGAWFTVRSRCFQLAQLPGVLRYFRSGLTDSVSAAPSVSGRIGSMKAFWSAVGCSVGIGNIMTISHCCRQGGPATLVWLWVGGFLGIAIKYSETFLSIATRSSRQLGGPAFYLRRAAWTRRLQPLFCALLAVYGTSVFSFRMVVDSVEHNTGIGREVAVFLLLSLVFLASIGGFKRVGSLCERILPIFLLLYLGCGLFIVFKNWDVLWECFRQLPSGCFQESVFGVSPSIAIVSGMQGACYSSNIGAGLGGMIHGQSACIDPKNQASLDVATVVVDIFLVCTITSLIILATGQWQVDVGPSLMVQQALARFLPYMDIFMVLLTFVFGYTSLISCHAIAQQSAFLLGGRHVKVGYLVLSAVLFVGSCYVSAHELLAFIMFCGAGLTMINLLAMAQLRTCVCFDLGKPDLFPDKVRGTTVDETVVQVVPSRSNVLGQLSGP